MTHTEKYIINAFSNLFENLSAISKLELLEKLTKSIKKDTKTKNSDFFKSFGAFESEKTAETIIQEIKSSRNFRDKNINFN